MVHALEELEPIGEVGHLILCSPKLFELLRPTVRRDVARFQVLPAQDVVDVLQATASERETDTSSEKLIGAGVDERILRRRTDNPGIDTLPAEVFELSATLLPVD